MFRKMIEEKNDFVKKFVKFVCLEDKDYGEEYLVCRNTGLQYLGEFLERFEREAINPIDIIKSISCVRGELKDHQIYDGQLDYFKGKLDLLMEENDLFLDKLCYVIFLQKLGYSEESNVRLNNLLDSVKFDLNFLDLTAAINYGSLVLEEECKNKIYEILNNCNLDLDCLPLIKECAEGEAFFKKATSLPVLALMEKTYELKAKCIKDSKRLKFFKSLKKIGTRKLEFEDIEEFTEMTKQDFYFISLKISYEINEGVVFFRTNEHLANLIESSLSVNTKTYPYLCQIKVSTDRNSYFKKHISLDNLNFNETEPEYYLEFAKAYFLNKSPIKYDLYKDIVTKDSFLNFFKELDYNEYKKFKNKIILNVIAQNDDKAINDFYFNNIDNLEDISVNNKLILTEKGYIDFVEFIEHSLIETTALGEKEICFVLNSDYWYSPKYKGIYNGQLEKYNLKYTAFNFLKYMMENSINITAVTSVPWMLEFSRDIYKVSFRNILDLSKDENEIKSNLDLVLDYIFMHDTGNYVKHIIKLYKDEAFSKYIDISEEEMKLICEECLNSSIEDYSLMSEIKSIVFDNKEVYLYECKTHVDKILDSGDWTYSYSNNGYFFDKLYYSFNKGNEECKSEIRDYIKEKMINTEMDSIRNMSVKILSCLIEKNIINKKDALEIVSSYLD